MASTEEKETVALRATVRGRVQGVGFRDFVYTRARLLALDGYVRNLPDGASVEVLAEGARPDLEQLLDYLQAGPGSARVDAVDVRWCPPSGSYKAFGFAS